MDKIRNFLVYERFRKTNLYLYQITHPASVKFKWSLPRENSRLLMNTRLLIG